MSIIKKILAVVSSVAIALSITACADTSWANKIDETKINSGIYIFYALEGYNNVSQQLSGKTYDGSIFDQKIEEKDVNTYVSDYATNMCKYNVAINNKFVELGLVLSETNEKAIALTVENELKGNADYYKKHGISEQSITEIVSVRTKQDLIFKKYYGAGGIEPVSQKDIDSQITKNYARVKILPLRLQKDDGSVVDDARKIEMLKKADGFIKKAKNGADFNDLINSYYKEIYPNEEAANSSADDNAVKDPYENETIVYTGYQNVDASAITEILALKKYDEPTLIKAQAYYYVVVKLDILERDDITEPLQSTALLELKTDDFNKVVEGWYADYAIELNQDSYDRYDIEKILKKDK